MKKFINYASLLFMGVTMTLSSCKKTEDPIPEDCNLATYPTSSGDASVTFKNTNIVSISGVSNLDVASGDYISISVEINKGTTRPQKLRVYQSDCINKVGTQVNFSGQPGTEDQGMTIDLRNDDTQIRTIGYSVPSGYSTLYLSFVVDESSNKYTYERVKLNISGSGIIDSWTGITLGAQGNAAASRLASATGQTFLACDAAANMSYIDVTYSASGAGPTSYLSSNPARFEAPISLSNSNPTCADDGALPTNGGRATYFKTSSADFDAATDATLEALTVSSSNNQYVAISGLNTVYEFLNSDGKKGLIKVTGGTLSSTSGAITVSVKVQR